MNWDNPDSDPIKDIQDTLQAGFDKGIQSSYRILKGWVPAEVVAHELNLNTDDVRAKAIMASRWDEKTWKVWFP